MMQKKLLLGISVTAVIIVMILSFNFQPTIEPGHSTAFALNQLRSSAPPVTTISYMPAYTSGSTNWVSASTQFTLSESGGSPPITTAYAVDTSMIPEETFERYTIGSDICGQGLWTSAGQQDPTCQAGTGADTTHTGRFVAISGSLNCQAFWALPPNQSSTVNCVSFQAEVTTTPTAFWCIWMEDSTKANNLFYEGFQMDGYCWLIAGANSVKIYPALYSINTWYYFKIYWNTASHRVWGSFSTDGVSYTTYNNSGAGYSFASYTPYYDAPYTHRNYGLTGYLDNLDCSWVNTFPYADWTSYSSAFSVASKPENVPLYIGYNSTANTVHEATNLATVKLDKTAPTITGTGVTYSAIKNASTSKGWILPTATIALAATDSLSGLGGIGYKWVGIAGTSGNKMYGIYSMPFSISSNGTYRVTWSSWDNVGNNESQSFIIRVDGLAPTTTCTFTASYTSGSKLWVNASTVFSLGVTDTGGSGLKNTCYKWSGTGSHAWTSCNTTFTLASMGNGTYNIQWCSWDSAGNNETLKNQVVFIDTIPTTTSISFVPEYTFDGKIWVNSSTPFMLTANDNPGGSGSAITMYKWDGSGSHSWAIYTGPFSLDGMPNGTYIISWWTWDYTLNDEYKNQTVHIDTMTPSTNIFYTPVYTSGPKIWVNSSTPFTLLPTENPGGSGVQNTWYKWSGSGSHAWTQYTAPFTLAGMGNGTYTISWCSWDNAGNNETINTQIVLIDSIAPTTAISYTPSGAPNHANLTTLFTISADDTLFGSGIENIYYMTDITGWMQYSAPFKLNGYVNGTYTINYYSIDNAGNAGSIHHDVVYLDIIGPTVVIASPGNQTYGTKDITIILSWADLDYSASWYKITNLSNSNIIISNKTWTSALNETMTNGTFLMQAWGIDTYGNIKQATSVIFSVDTSAPQIQLIRPVYSTYINANLFVEVRNFSRADTVKFCYNISSGWSINVTLHYNGTRWVNDTVSLPDGHYQIQVFASWLTSPVTKISRRFTIDTAPPITTIIVNAAYVNVATYLNSSSTIRFMISDLSFISVTKFWFDSQTTWHAFSTPFTLSSYGLANGLHVIHFNSTDIAGNNEVTNNVQVYLDIMAPTTNILYTPVFAPNFVTTSTPFSLSPSDGSGQSGVAYTRYNLNDTGWNTGLSFNLIGFTNGTITIQYHSTDNVGNSEAIKTITVKIDTIAPTTIISYTPSYAPDYVSTITPFTLSGSDNAGGSSLASRSYNINGSGWVTGNSFTLAGWINGTITIQYRSSDNAGNIGMTQFITVRLDTIAPATSISYTATYTSGPKKWLTSATPITLTATDNADGSHVFKTYYKWSGTGSHAWAQYSTSFSLAGMGNGTYTISWCSWDNAGNNETLNNQVVYIDTVAPSTTIGFTAVYTSGSKNWVSNVTSFMLTATENTGGSQVFHTYYKWSGSGSHVWTLYTGSFILNGMSNGTYTISYCSWDNAINNETLKTQDVLIDTIAPSTSIAYTVAYAPNFVNMATVFTLTYSDNIGGSSIGITQFQYTGSSGYHAYLTPFTLSSAMNGTITIQYYSTDHAGNMETAGTLVVRLDAITPSTSITYTAGYAPNFVTIATVFTLTRTDNTGGSGIAFTLYEYTGSGGYHLYTTPFTLSSATNGTITIQYCSTDHTGNVESTGILIVQLDMIAPTTVISYTAAHAPNFVSTTTAFTLISTDNTGGSGISFTRYQYTGSGGYSVYTAPFTLSLIMNGTIIINYYSTDHMGYVETTHTLIVRLDTIAPYTNISFTPAGGINHVNSTTRFTLTSQDNAGGSGVASIQYQYTGSGGGWISYTGPFTLPLENNGSVVIMFRAIDNAGNAEVSGTVTVQLFVIPGSTPTGPQTPSSFWDAYGVWIIAIAVIGVVIIAVVGSVAAHKKKVSIQSKMISSKELQRGKMMAQPEWNQPANSGKAMTQPSWIQPATTASLSLEEVRSHLKHLFVFHSRTSVCLFYQPFTEVTIDPQLIAGFISAISSFGETFEKEAELKVLEYKSFKVLLEESVSCKYALLFSGEMNDKLNELLKGFMGEFESKFKKALSNFDGNVSMFNLASDIMASVFKMTAPTKNMAFQIGTASRIPTSEPLPPVNLYCSHCGQWKQISGGIAVTGAERCALCDQPLYFVPICDNCGYKVMKPVEEFLRFKQSSMQCEQCGNRLRIQ